MENSGEYLIHFTTNQDVFLTIYLMCAPAEPCLTMTRPRTRAFRARASTSSLATSFMWWTPQMTSGGRPGRWPLKERWRKLVSSPARDGKVTQHWSTHTPTAHTLSNLLSALQKYNKEKQTFWCYEIPQINIYCQVLWTNLEFEKCQLACCQLVLDCIVSFFDKCAVDVVSPERTTMKIYLDLRNS